MSTTRCPSFEALSAGLSRSQVMSIRGWGWWGWWGSSGDGHPVFEKSMEKDDGPLEWAISGPHGSQNHLSCQTLGE